MSSPEDDSFDDSSDGSEEEEEISTKKRKNIIEATKTKRKKIDSSLIDDAAVLSGEDDDEDDDEDEEGDANDDYVRDDFVVDEVDELNKNSDDGLEDSDDESSDDDGERGTRIRKLKEKSRLDDDDLALIDEAQGARHLKEVEKEEPPKKSIKARTEAELRKELFDISDEELEKIENNKGSQMGGKSKSQRQMETYDEDGMDDFIEYGDDDDRRGYTYDDDALAQREGISEAQLNEATDIFGTDFMDFMIPKEEDEEDDMEYDPEHDHYRERGVGVELGVELKDDQDSFSEDDDEDELFGNDEESGGLTADQRSEALRLKKEKRRLAKEERRRAAAKKQLDKRKAKLRKAFEPVQLVENFCTERDDEIRSKDIPERFFDWSTPFHGPDNAKANVENVLADFSDEERKEATWMVPRIPEIRSEFSLGSNTFPMTMDELEPKQLSIVVSIMQSLRYMHIEKLEPEFIRKYREDYVTSKSVRDNLYAVMDEDSEWERILIAKRKVHILIDEISIDCGDDAFDANDENIMKIKSELKTAERRLIDTTQVHDKIDQDLKKLESTVIEGIDTELFGDDEKDDENQMMDQQIQDLRSRLETYKGKMQEYAEEVTQMIASLKLAREQLLASHPNHRVAIEATNKACLDKVLNAQGYVIYLEGLTEYRQVMDLYKYLHLIKEGTDAVHMNSFDTPNAYDRKKRSRRFDRDYYRTCVSQGLREICYKFALSPFRVGIKLCDSYSALDSDKDLPSTSESMTNHAMWSVPVIQNDSPESFASSLVSSGELVLLTPGKGDGYYDDSLEILDPLRPCRYVTAMELAFEPRIRNCLRVLFRSNALLSTLPTAKGLESIDAHHDYYGLHLIRNKCVKDHYADDTDEIYLMGNLSNDEKKDFKERSERRRRDSCLQYLNIMKAERSGHLKHFVHLPLSEEQESWYQQGGDYFSRDKQNSSLLLDALKKVYLSDNDTQEWNDERIKVLNFAIHNFLLPQFEAEIKNELRDMSMKVGIHEAGRSLRTMANEGPYRPSHMLGHNRFLVPTGDLPIVGVCCSSDGKDASFLAAVSERGKLIDHLAVPGGTQIDSDKIRSKLITFLMQTRPAAIVVGCLAGLSCRLVARKLGALVTEATEKWNNRHIQGYDEDDDDYDARQEEFMRLYPNHDDDDEQAEWKCNVEMVDDNVAQLFGRSIRGRKEFPDSATNLKCAIAIARHAKDPLAELAYTYCAASDAGLFGTEMLFIDIHPLQQILPKTLLLREYERVLCRAVADVGVDVNLACKYDHLLGLLTFVPGLGPRKGANMKNSLERLGGAIASRKDLLKKRLLGPTVYNNSVAFLRIRDVDSLRNQFLHPLDDTRLHPDVYIRYKWATKIAIDALEMDSMEMESNADKEEYAISAINDIMQDSKNEIKRLFDATKLQWEQAHGATFNVGDWNPRENVPSDSWRDKVEELDLETFSEIIEKNSGYGKWFSHLTMIKWEFRLPFTDPRKPMEPLDKEKLFYLLTGENDQTLCPGKEVTGKVARISDFGVHLKLEGDIPAFIPRRNLADHAESAEAIFQIGANVTSIITEVKKDHMSVDLSLTSEDFKKRPSDWPRPGNLRAIDSKFDRRAAEEIESTKCKEREERLDLARKQATGNIVILEPTKKRTNRVTRRACAHPAFRNSSNQEVEKELIEGGEFMVGEALIRPSNKHADCLAVHWLYRKGCTKVIEVVEEDKDNDASIGSTLRIKNDVYGSIDELLARYIGPMNDFVQQLVSHRKFRNISEYDVDEKLKELKLITPDGIFYFLSWNEKYPGYASLRYIVNTPRYHHIAITPEGFQWNRKNYPSLDFLLNDFKKNPHGSQQSSSASKDTSSSWQSTTSIKTSRWGARTSDPASSGSSIWPGAAPPLPPTHLPPPPHQTFRPVPPKLPPPPLGQRPFG